MGSSVREQSTKSTELNTFSDNLLQIANHNYLTCDGLDAADEGLHVLLAARLVLVEVGPRRRLVVPRRPLAARRLVTTDLVCCKMNSLFTNSFMSVQFSINTFVCALGLQGFDLLRRFLVRHRSPRR